MGLTHTLNERIFSRIHGNNLVYNTCWEDPRCDREILQIDDRSQVVMLTSAGCNALDYLLDNPANVHCVDLNPRQNALLELKLALFKSTDYRTLFDFFGVGATPHAREVFHDAAKHHLDDAFSRLYWEQNLHYFAGRGLRRSFYWHGTSGTVAWLVQQWLQTQPEALRFCRKLMEADTLAEQCIWYEQMEPRFLNPFIRWFLQQHFVQSMLGVPKSQQKLAAAYFPDGMAGYLRHCLRQVFTGLPLADNYFWKLYFWGRYTPNCCPNYLRPEYFDTLRARSGQMHTYTCSLAQFLQENPGQYSHFILLDHQDWLAAHLQSALHEEWRLILQNAAPGARILLRSAAFEVDFLPDFVHDHVTVDREAAERSQRNDRVGTYASTWVATVR